MNWFTDSQSIMQVLFDATWQSAMLTVIVLVLLALLGRWIAPSWRVVLLAIPLLRLVVLVLPVTTFSLFQWVDRPMVTAPAMIANGPDVVTTASNPEVGLAQPLPPLNQSQPTAAIKDVAAADPIAKPRSLAQLAFVVWLIGVSLAAAFRLWCMITLRRELRRGDRVREGVLRELIDTSCRHANLSRPVTCILTDEELGPATCGWVRPKIVISRRLATELSPGDLLMIFDHEVEHIRRNDSLLLSLAHVAVTLHWFNPLAYLLRRLLQREIELAVDASVLRKRGVECATPYGDLLIRIAGRSHRTLGTVQMASGRNLRRRIRALVSWRRPRAWQFALGATLASGLVLAGLSDSHQQSAFAREAAVTVQPDTTESDSGQQESDTTQDDSDATSTDADRPAKRVSGRVVDANGKPVAGAKLTADVYYEEDAGVRTVSATANDKGEFSIEYPLAESDYEAYHTWAYAKGHGIRTVSMSRVLATDTRDDVEIRLPTLESEEFKLLQPNGEPCVGVVVRPRYVQVPNGVFAADEPTGLSGFLPTELKPILEQKTDENGRVTIEGIPSALLRSLEVETSEFGIQNFSNLDEILRLSDVGEISGALLAEDPSQYAGIKIHVKTERRGIPSPQISWASYGEGIAETELDETGRFVIPAIAIGTPQISIMWDSNSPVHPAIPRLRQDVSSEVPLRLAIEARPTVLVSGRIVTSDTREPVVGAQVSHRPVANGLMRIPNYTRTDADGRYTTRLPAGEARRQVFAGIKLGYEHPRLEPVVIPAGVTEYEIDEILVHPKRLVRGTVLDRSGRPMPDVTVGLHTGSFRHVAGRAVTDAKGEFEMRVRNWNLYKTTKASRWYWAIITQPTDEAKAPTLTKLAVLDHNPEHLRLRILD